MAASTSHATNCMNAVDTNVLVYALDSDDPARQAKAHDLISRLIQKPDGTVLLWQVAGELLACLRKWESAGRLTTDDASAYFHDVLSIFPLQMPSATTFDISFQLRSRFSLSHWDAMLLAACKDASITTLFSEDMAAGTNFDGVVIINPFV